MLLYSIVDRSYVHVHAIRFVRESWYSTHRVQQKRHSAVGVVLTDSKPSISTHMPTIPTGKNSMLPQTCTYHSYCNVSVDVSLHRSKCSGTQCI